MFRLNRKAQSTAEYAIVIALVVAAVVGMQVYVRRGLQARTKGAVDYMVTNTPELGSQTQFEPTEVTRDITQTRTSPIREEVSSEEATAGQVTRTIVGTETSGARGYEREGPPAP